MVDCKICEHPYCEHAGKQRGIVIDCANYMPRQKPRTNADRIRAMSDEELAAYLVYHNPYSTEEFCLKWLRQPVKDGDGE